MRIGLELRNSDIAADRLVVRGQTILDDTAGLAPHAQRPRVASELRGTITECFGIILLWRHGVLRIDASAIAILVQSTLGVRARSLWIFWGLWRSALSRRSGAR